MKYLTKEQMDSITYADVLKLRADKASGHISYQGKFLINNPTDYHKVGVDEVVNLKSAMETVMLPVRDALRAKAYWNRELQFDELEYKRRDGFIPHSHNHGGVSLGMQIPECEQYEWDFLEFGELTEEYLRDEDPYENEGELDAYLKIILKFEGIDENGVATFYLNVSGGNNDAPYFRNIPTLLETEFTCKTVAGLSRAASKHVKAVVALINGTKAVSRE